MAHALKSNCSVVVCLHEYVYIDGDQSLSEGSRGVLASYMGRNITRKVITEGQLAQKQSKLEDSNNEGTKRIECTHEPPRPQGSARFQLQML